LSLSILRWSFPKPPLIDFIRKILVGKLNSRRVIVGFNHHFGHNREGDYEYLHELGKYYNFEVEEIPEQDIDNETVSSTKIRKALIEGNIQRANAYLDHHYIISGIIRKKKSYF
jgi:riboflavin kinase / FMN adenylyltransferase